MNIRSFLTRVTRRPKPAFARSLAFSGPGVYEVVFEGTSFGVVFEDDGETGYLYVTNERHDEIHDAMHIYDHGGPCQFSSKTRAYVVFNPELLKAGLYADRQFHAIVDFRNRRCCCRTGFPKGVGNWRLDHAWIQGIEKGLDP